MDQRDYKTEFEQKLHEDIHRNIHERIGERMRRPNLMFHGDFHWGFIMGLVIALVGIALLLHHLGVIPFDPVARFWPVLLILFGLNNLLSGSGRFLGFLLLFAGTVLQLNKLGLTHFSFADLWPIALIGVGALLMWGSLEARGFIDAKRRMFQHVPEQAGGKTETPLGGLNAVAIFGGCERRISSKNFQGGKATAFLGGIELDFRNADIDNEAGEAILEINCVLGGVEIRVPESWHVHSRAVPVLGGYEDTSRQEVSVPDGKPKILVITGMVILGGVEIRN